MTITIKLFATLQKGRFDIETREIAPDTPIQSIIEDLGISKEEAAIIFVNHKHAPLDYQLKEGDILAIFPPIGGG